MLSIASVGSPGGASAYYINSKYYTNQDGRSYWGGGAKEALGLPEGEVGEQELTWVLAGTLPNGQQLGRMKDGELLRDYGRDFTFSAPKSVSMLLLTGHRQIVYEAHDQAIRKTMEFFEKNFAVTRKRNSETGKQDTIGNQKIVYAVFREDLSRANDMALHGHVVTSNLALGEDGKYRSLKFSMAYEQKILMGAIYRAELGHELKKSGIALEPAGKHGLWEVKDVPKDAIQAFSKRRQAILEAAKEGPKDPRTLADLVLMTRPKKESVDRETLETRWHAEFAKLGHSFKSLLEKALKVRLEDNLSPEKALSNAIADLSENNRHYHKYEVLKAGLTSVYGNVRVETLQAEIDKQVQQGKLLKSEDGQFLTTPKVLRLEQAVLEEYDKGHLRSGVMTTKAFEKQARIPTYLKDEQAEAVKFLMTSQDRVALIQGSAGVGKTTIFKQAVPLARSNGLRVIGLAPTSKATEELTKTGLFNKTMTLQKFLLTPEGTSSTMLVLDEASMVGTRDMLSLIRFANSKKMPRLVLAGDKNQHKPIAAGEPFKHLQENGARTAYIKEIIRQENPRHREAIQNLADGKIKQALESYKKEIHQVDGKDMIGYAADRWMDLNSAKTAVIVQTHAQKTALNNAIKQRVHARSAPTGKSINLSIRLPVSLTEREQRCSHLSYENATHIRFNRPQSKLGVKGGEEYQIIVRNKDTASLTLSNGKKTINFVPAKHGGGESMLEVYQESQITLHEGDRIRFTRGNRGTSAGNNDMGHVTKISDKALTIELDKGKSVSFSFDHAATRHIDHGWANTGHAYQGQTEADAILLMPSYKSPLTSLESLYIGASRHKETLAIITDDAKRLGERIETQHDVSQKDITFSLEEHRDGNMKELEGLSGNETGKDNEIATEKSNQSNERPNADQSDQPWIADYIENLVNEDGYDRNEKVDFERGDRGDRGR